MTTTAWSQPPLAEVDGKDARLADVLRDMNGSPINVHRLMANHPELLRAWWPFRIHAVTGGELGARRTEIVVLVTADAMQNAYEWDSHVDRGLAAGLTSTEIAAIQSHGGRWAPADALLIDMVRALTDRHRIPPALLERAKAHYSPREVMDVIFVHGAYVTLGGLLNSWPVPLDDEVATRLEARGEDVEAVRFDAPKRWQTAPASGSTGARSSAVIHRSPGHAYPLAVSAEGMTITDADGRTYLDMSGGAAVSCLGHGHPNVVAAIRRQADRLAFAHTAFFTNESQEQLGRRIAGRFGEEGAAVCFLSGGSEANETALKMAWQYWAARGKPEKKVVISREHSYHGNTFIALSVSGNPGRRRASAAPLIDWPRIAPCYAYREQRAGESGEDYAVRAADELEAAILERGADNVAAFLCEPVVGSSLGVVPAVPGYLARVRDICDRHDVLLILDEVMSGCGRTGRYFAHEADGVVPDLVTLAKGIGAGYMPLAAVVARERVAGQLRKAGFAHGHTYIGHAIACAAGLAVFDTIESERLLERTQRMGVRLRDRCREAFGDHPNVGDVRGRGLFVGLELVADRDSKRGFAGVTGLPDRLRNGAMARGLLCYPGSVEIDGATVPHIMLAPPMIVEEEHIEQCMAVLEDLFADELPR